MALVTPSVRSALAHEDKRIGREPLPSEAPVLAPIALPKSAPPPRFVDAPAFAASEARIDIDGGFTKRRFHVHVNRALREIQRQRFIFFLRLVAAHFLKPGSYSGRRELGIARSQEIPTRIREACGTALPPGFNIIESDTDGRVRLNPGVTLGDIAWKTLAELGPEEIREIASDVLRRARPSTMPGDDGITP